MNQNSKFIYHIHSPRPLASVFYLNTNKDKSSDKIDQIPVEMNV